MIRYMAGAGTDLGLVYVMKVGLVLFLIWWFPACLGFLLFRWMLRTGSPAPDDRDGADARLVGPTNGK